MTIGGFIHRVETDPRNKQYLRFIRSGRRLQTGYPPHFRRLIAKGVDELRKEGIIRVMRERTGSDFGDHAVLVKARLSQARGLLNGFRTAQRLPRLGADLETYLPVK